MSQLLQRILRRRPVHRAKLIDQFGNVSPLCSDRPRPLNLKTSTWTNQDLCVTCPKCKARIRALVVRSIYGSGVSP